MLPSERNHYLFLGILKSGRTGLISSMEMGYVQWEEAQSASFLYTQTKIERSELQSGLDLTAGDCSSVLKKNRPT